VTHFSACRRSVFILTNKAGGFKAIFLSGHKRHHDIMFAEVSAALSVEICQHPHFMYNWFANEALFLHNSENATVLVRKFLYQPAYGQNF
jgi:hypothetical protein